MIFEPELETMPREQLYELQLERFRSLVGYVKARVPLYRERLADLDAQDIASLDDIRRLPFTRKDDLRDTYPLGMLATPRAELARIHASSGTTGKPTVVAGVNVYPSHVGSILGRVPELSPHFGLVVRRLGTLDEVEVLAEPRAEVLPLTDERVRELSERAAALIRDTIGCTMAVTLVGPGEAPRSDGGKIQRVTHLRSHA